MATFSIDDYIVFNSFKNIDSISWEVSETDTFEVLIDQTYKNKDIKSGWYSRLNKLDGSGYYDEFTTLYARCKIHTVNGEFITESDWFTKAINQTLEKRVRITRNGQVVGEVSIDENNNCTTIW